MGTQRSLTPVPSAADPLTYETYFGLTEKPFSLNADPRFLYRSPSHAATFENLLAGIRRREGLLVLTGEIGTGKTMLCRAVLRNLGRKTFSSFVPDPYASREDLLKMLLIDFGVMSIEDLTTGPFKQASRTELSYLLSGFLESIPPLEAFVVVIIDEAQNMSLPLIEETRILADSFGSKGHLQIVFVGQPELLTKLKLPEMRQVDQRVCGYSRLAPLGRDAVAGYIEHRLHVAGLSRERVLFSPELIDILHRRCGGVPRLINRICDRALHHAHLRQAAAVDLESLETALIEVGPATLTPTWDSIISTAPEVARQPEVAPRPEAAPRPSAPTAPPVAAAQPPAAEESTTAAVPDLPGGDDFDMLVDDWVNHDLATAPGKFTQQNEVATRLAVPSTPPAPQAPRRTVPRPVAKGRDGAQSPWSDTRGPLRSETYLQRLTRVWTRRLAWAAGGIVAMFGAALLANAVANALASPESPALPAAPAAVVLNLARPAPPSVETIQPAASGDYYLVAVGLFADADGADRIVRELTQAGLPAGQRLVQFRGQSVQQVVLGPFANRSEAVDNMNRLRGLGTHDDARVIAIAREPAAR